MRCTVKTSQFKVVYNQNNKTNQWYFIIVDKWSDKRVGSSYKSYKDAERYLLDTGLINSLSVYPEFESIFTN